MLTLISVSGKQKVWGFLFAYPGSVVVSMQVCHAQDSGSSPHGVKTEKYLDHPQMINHKATSTPYHQYVHASAVWEIFLGQK